MSDEWVQTIWASIDLGVAAIILSLATLLGSFAILIGNVQQQEIDAIEVAQEYRQFNKYDNTTVYPQDVISVIFETHGYPEVWVDTDESVIENYSLKWVKSIPADNVYWDLTHVTSILPVTGVYQSIIHRNANGEIDRLEFRRN
jgi:hypothetical protein